MNPSRRRLLAALAAFSYRTGDFKLSSGGRSPVLIDASKALRRGDIMPALVDLIGPLPGSAHGVGGPALGADPMAVAVLALCPDLYWFSVRREPKDHGLDTSVITGPTRPNDRVILVEDVITTGGSVLRAAAACKAAQLKVLMVLACVDREEGGRRRIEDELDVPCTALVTKSDIEAFRREEDGGQR